MNTNLPESLFVEWTEEENPFITTWTGAPGPQISQDDADALVDHLHVPDSIAEQLSRLNTGISQSGYHRATRDHPFLDMSSGNAARIEDAAIMAGFVLTDEYPDIYLDLKPAGQAIKLPHALHLGLDELRLAAGCRLALILGGALGVVKEQQPYYDPVTDYHQVANLRKAVPSGGARHPTEGFVHVHRSPDVPPGWYHFAPQENALVPILPLEQEASLTSEIEQSTADHVLAIYLHSVVERAYFRYRDPRSMRAILVDAGHVDGQISALANYCNWDYKSKLSIALHANFERRDGTSVHAPRLVSGLLQGWS